VIAGLVLSVYLKPSLSADSKKWENHLLNSSNESFNIDGNYTLASFSDSYETFLKAIGVPWYALPVILSGSESFEFRLAEDGASQVISTGFNR